jgi:two-component system sensor histidine kinase YesM
MNKTKNASIQKQILVNIWGILLPMMILLAVTLASLFNFYRQYDSIVQNITMANGYNLSFKKEMDEVMYQIIVGSIHWTDNTVRAKLGDSNPYRQIENMRNKFEKLKDRNENTEIERDLDSTLSLLKTLENRVTDVLKNVDQGGHYDSNIKMFNMDITILTSLIQNSIQEYIYKEASQIEILRQQVARHVQLFLRIMLTILIAMVFLNIALSRYISKRVIRPIDEMCKATESIAKGNFLTTLRTDNGNELDVLANRFNHMGGEIQHLIACEAREQKEKQSLELKLLTAEINPHFLYNTLDTIVWLTEAGEKEEAVQILSYLSDFFRVSLSNGLDVIPVADEKKHIESYLAIQHMRFQDIMDYEIRIDPQIENLKIVKMTLQPLVENAIYHGIRNRRSKGFIRVTGSSRDNDMLFVIQDNGRGMEKDELDAFRQKILTGDPEIGHHGHGGFGVANVAARLKLYYGENMSFTVRSLPNLGTEVRLLIPKEMDHQGL